MWSSASVLDRSADVGKFTDRGSRIADRDARSYDRAMVIGVRIFNVQAKP
jgi:hypothetical protein